MKSAAAFIRYVIIITWPTWSQLRSIGNSPAVRASIIVPVIGYLIILNSTIADYLKLHGVEWPVHHPATFWDHAWSIKLYLMYFGLMFLGVGAAVYQWQCPHFVKKYADWSDYVAGTASHTNLDQIDSLQRILGVEQTRSIVDDGSLSYFASDEEKRDAIRGYLRAHYRLMSSAGKHWRGVTTVLFSVGFFLLAIPSLMTAARVAISLLSRDYGDG